MAIQLKVSNGYFDTDDDNEEEDRLYFSQRNPDWVTNRSVRSQLPRFTNIRFCNSLWR